jgi:atypical dual specificity phosphatase
MAKNSLDLKEYGISYGSKVVLADITFCLPVNGITVLMGPVGTGKSSLLRSLAGISQGNSRFNEWGDAFLNDLPISGQHHPILVQQKITQLSLTVENAILSQAKLNDVNIAKRQAYVTNIINQFSAEPLLSRLKQRLIDISPNYQRMTHIIAALASNPPLLMIDEPTTDLSKQESVEMMSFIRNVGKQMKLVVVLHNQQQAHELADDIVLIAGGRVQFHGAREQFFAKTSPNAIVKQFIQTGSVSLPAPDAQVEDLADDVVLPPPLPQKAIDAIQPFISEKNHASESKDKAVLNATEDAEPLIKGTEASAGVGIEVKGSANKKESAKTSKKSKNKKQEKVKKNASQEQKTSISTTNDNTVHSPKPAKPLRELPMPSKYGVEIVASIGKKVASTSQGPKGFVWIVDGVLAGCPMPGVSSPISYDLGLIASIGVTYLITLTEEDLDQEELEVSGLRNLHLPIYDRETPSLNQMHMLLFKMQKLIDDGEVLAVHCLAGIGRTGTVLAAWMIKEGGITADESIKRLRLINSSFVQTKMQEDFLVDFENDIIKRLR